MTAPTDGVGFRLLRQVNLIRCFDGSLILECSNGLCFNNGYITDIRNTLIVSAYRLSYPAYHHLRSSNISRIWFTVSLGITLFELGIIFIRTFRLLSIILEFSTTKKFNALVNWAKFSLNVFSFSSFLCFFPSKVSTLPANVIYFSFLFLFKPIHFRTLYRCSITQSTWNFVRIPK